MHWIGLAMLICMAAAALALSQNNPRDPEIPDVVSVRALHIVDAAGRNRIVMETLPDGTATITMRDTEGDIHLALRVASGGGSHLLLFDPKDKPRIDIQARDGAFVKMLDSRGNEGISMISTQDHFALSVQPGSKMPVHEAKE